MRKVIIFYISEFGGHSKAAENIKEALQYRNPGIDTVSIDGLRFFYPHWHKIVDFTYGLVIKHIPSFWGRIYDRDRTIKSLLPLRKQVNKFSFKKLSRLIGELNPPCFIATQAFPCGIVADFKQRFNVKIPLIAIVTDYYPHRFWIHPCVDKYVVACQEAKEILIREGIKEDKIKILGIPISLKFLNTYSKDDISASFGFLPGVTSVLIMGGGWGIGPMRIIAQELDRLEDNVQIIVVCGKNKRLFRWFRSSRSKFRKPVFYFGYISFVHKIMDFSDIIITKGGGITISESLSKGLAIIITSPIPGQEERNVNYLSKREIAIRVNDIKSIKYIVKEVVDDKKTMYSLKEKARKASVIDSSLRIVDLILGEIA